MADKNNSFPKLLKFFKFMIAFGLEEHISYGQCLVYNQDFRLYINGNRKSQTNEHTARIGLHRLVYILSDICKFQNIR